MKGSPTRPWRCRVKAVGVTVPPSGRREKGRAEVAAFLLGRGAAASKATLL